jgi:hypothetical protein
LDGSFLLSGYSNFYSSAAGAGYTTGVAGGTFPAPAGPVLTNVVWLPDGTSLVGWGGDMAQQRSAGGALLGSPQTVPSGDMAIGADAGGDATAAGVNYNGSAYELDVSTRAAAGPSFGAAMPVASSGAGSPMTLVGLAVDPDGAAVVTWAVGTTLYQATRPAGAGSPFGAAATIASNLSGQQTMGANAAGKAVLVYYDGTGYSAAIRSPAGSFGAPVDISGAVTSALPADTAAAVAADGSAGVLVGSSAPASGCGTLYRLHAFRLAAGASTWSPGGDFGGAQGDSIAFPALAGGPGGRIDAAWSVDTRSASQVCLGVDDPYEIAAGTLGGALTPILSVTPPPFSGGTYGSGHTGGFAAKMALNACGDGALIVGIADSQNSDLHDGLFTSTTQGCPPGGGKPVNTSLPAVSGTARVGQVLSASTGGWSGTPSPAYTYQWQLCNPACADIPSQTSASLIVAAADVGAQVRVVVTATNPAGNAAADSSQVGPVQAAVVGPPPPVQTTPPTASVLRASLLKALAPTGQGARIATLRKQGGYSFAFTALTAGRVKISWYFVPRGAHVAKAKPATVLVATGSASFAKAGTRTLKIKLTSKGKRLLKHAKHLKLTAKGTFVPTGKSGIVALATFTLKH